MKRIEAYLRMNKVEEVKQALEDAGIAGMTVEHVRGYGRQFGRTDKYRGSTYAVNLLPKARVDVVVKDFCEDATNNLHTFTEEEWREFLRTVIQTIFFFGERITIKAHIPLSGRADVPFEIGANIPGART